MYYTLLHTKIFISIKLHTKYDHVNTTPYTTIQGKKFIISPFPATFVHPSGSLPNKFFFRTSLVMLAGIHFIFCTLLYHDMLQIKFVFCSRPLIFLPSYYPWTFLSGFIFITSLNQSYRSSSNFVLVYWYLSRQEPDTLTSEDASRGSSEKKGC